MKTYVVDGVKHVEVFAGIEAGEAVRTLSRELFGADHVCGVCANFKTRGSKTRCCPSDNYLVRADVWPILKMRMPPGTVR